MFESIGMYAWRVSPGSPGGATYFPTYKAAACHYARSRPCNQSNRGIWLVTIQSRPSDRDAGRSMANSPSKPAGLRFVIYTNQAIYLLCLITPSWCQITLFFRNITPFFAIYIYMTVYNQNSALYVTQGGVRWLYSTGI